MATPGVLRLGHPMLRQLARPFSEGDIVGAEAKRLVQSMVSSMERHGGCGLAAPQIGVSRRLLVVDYPPNFDRFVAFNPKIEPVLPSSSSLQGSKDAAGDYHAPLVDLNDTEAMEEVADGISAKIEMWEECLSIPELMGLVPRYGRIKMSYLDELARPRAVEATGIMAAVLQHEYDHLDGVVWLDRVADKSTIAYRQELHEYLQPDYPPMGDVKQLL